MPAVTPAAIARKAQRKNESNRAKRAAELAAAGRTPTVTSMNRKWRIGPKMPEMSKAELRAMFAQAMAVTAGL